jgi:hypothetical protein
VVHYLETDAKGQGKQWTWVTGVAGSARRSPAAPPTDPDVRR